MAGIGVGLYCVFMDQDAVKINILPCLGETSIALNLNNIYSYAVELSGVSSFLQPLR